MTSLLDTPPTNVLEVLRGDRHERPPLDMTAAAGLRAELEDGIYALIGPALRDQPLVVRASSLRGGAATDSPVSPHAQVRGLLVTQALRLLGAGLDPQHAFDESLAAWRDENPSGPLSAFVDGLDDDQRARLASDVSAHWETLARSLGTLPHQWLPRTALRAHQRLAGGNVVLRDVVDLMVGSTTSDDASVALLDVTTSRLDEGSERVLRFHALVQTLRTSVVPLRTSIFSSATGELWCADVDRSLLARAIDDVLAAITVLRDAR